MTRLTSCVALGFFAATVGLCQSPPASAAEPDSVELTMSRLLVANNDVAAFAEFMAEDATMFFPPSAPGARPGSSRAGAGKSSTLFLP